MKKFKALSALMKYFTEVGPTGCACMVSKGGEAVFEKYCGYIDKEGTKPVAPDTIYRVYSMTKVITCTAALMLYERGLYFAE